MLVIDLSSHAGANPEIHRRADWAQQAMDLIEAVGTGPVELLQWLLTGEFLDDSPFKSLVLREFVHQDMTVRELLQRLNALQIEQVSEEGFANASRLKANVQEAFKAVG